MQTAIPIQENVIWTFDWHLNLCLQNPPIPKRDFKRNCSTTTPPQIFPYVSFLFPPGSALAATRLVFSSEKETPSLQPKCGNIHRLKIFKGSKLETVAEICLNHAHAFFSVDYSGFLCNPTKSNVMYCLQICTFMHLCACVVCQL